MIEAKKILKIFSLIFEIIARNFIFTIFGLLGLSLIFGSIILFKHYFELKKITANEVEHQIIFKENILNSVSEILKERETKLKEIPEIFDPFSF